MDNITANFEINTDDSFDAIFEINAAGTTWGSIDGDINDQTDLKNALDALSGDIAGINTTIDGYGDIVTHNVTEFATATQGTLADTALQPNDNISELVNNADYQSGSQVTSSISVHNSSTEAHTYIQDLISTEASLRASATEALSGSIQAETTARSEAISLAVTTTEGYADSSVSVHNSSTEAHPYIQSVLSASTTEIVNTIGDLTSLTTSTTSSIVNAINSEVSDRNSADSSLQGQIDALAAASDVTDIVGTYAELQAYDTSHLNNNDIIKVLSDSTHDNQPSYYRYNKTTDTFSYIGSESAAYTKAQSDSIFVTKTTEINGHALSSDITLTYSDVNALPSSTVIGDGKTIFKKNGTAFSTISANQTTTVNVDYTIPTQASDIGALPSTTTITDLVSTTQMEAINSGVTSTIVAQVGTNASNIASNTSTLAQHTTAIASNTSSISTINGKIPTDASSSNKLISASTLAASTSILANQDLSNLTSTGEARLHALKSYADKGELLTDAEGLADVKNYAHSTFDKSKFTVVGSPMIKNDGIASGFSNANYIYISDFDVSKPWKINLSFTTASNVSTLQYIFRSTATPFGLQMIVNDNELWMGFNTAGGVLALTHNASANTNYTGYIEWTGTQYNFALNGTVQTVSSSNALAVTGDYNLGAYYGDTGAFLGSIDLKGVNIIVDGIPVFSGNKTGIDTIKPDDYQVVGTPTISADGIASGFSDSNYLTTTFPTVNTPASTTTIVEIYGRFKVNSLPANRGYIQGVTVQNQTQPCCFIKSDGILGFSLYGATEIFTSSAITLNTDIDYHFILDSERKWKVYWKYASTETWTDLGYLDWGLGQTVALSGTMYLGRNIDGNSQPFTTGSIDLNAFKIYVAGNLIYQPCLKIPYTQSKTGSKIVSSPYRDRVSDMYNQFGYAPYYTLSDTNFTLPQGELYGLIGQRTLRDSYRNGINYWELYSNRDLEQGGSCTSGTEVTFAKPFSDTNYVLSVPYSAKSATAFTPTQTGDWIAKGKGTL